MNGSACGSACCQPVGRFGKTEGRTESSVCAIASTKAATVATPNERNRAIRTTPNTGTRNWVANAGESCCSGAIIMPAKPARTLAMIQFPPARRVAESPVTAAPASFSAAARVLRPKRVKRYTTATAAVRTIAMPASQT